MRQIALGMLVTGLLATTASAQEPVATAVPLKMQMTALAQAPAGAAPVTAPAAPAPEAKKVAVLVGADVPSLYLFRGYRQETDPGFTFQPLVDVAVAGEKASFNVGLWNSFHTGSLKDAGYGYYETDFYAAVTVSKIKTTYTAYTYPKLPGDATIHELMFSTSFDNVLAPSVALAFEFKKPAGLDKGVYLELGINPAAKLADDAPVTVTFPVKVGLSLKDYYGGDAFGYVSGGVSIGHSLTKGELHGSVLIYGFGDTLKAFNNNKAGQAVGSVGFSIGF